jgi:hypothetical protein
MTYTAANVAPRPEKKRQKKPCNHVVSLQVSLRRSYGTLKEGIRNSSYLVYNDPAEMESGINGNNVSLTNVVKPSL